MKPLFSEALVTKDWTKLAQQAARNLVEDTQWIYARGASPYAARSHPMMFQFGTWPANAVHYMRKLARLGPKGPAKLAALWAGILYMGGEVFGIDVRSWIPLYSFLYKGGPALSTALKASEAVGSTMYGSPMAGKEWKEFLQSMWIWMPAGLEAKNITRAIDEEAGIKRVLGFRSSGEKKKPMGPTRGGRGGRGRGRGGR